MPEPGPQDRRGRRQDGDGRGERHNRSDRPERSDRSEDTPKRRSWDRDRDQTRRDRPRREDGPRRDDRPRWEERPRSGERRADRGADRPRERPTRPAPQHKPAHDKAGDQAGSEAARPPELPEEIEYSALDPAVRAELRALPKTLAEQVGRHLVAAGMLLDEDPELALRHARFARLRASRVGVVREAAGLAAYEAGEWSEALAELRAARRMSAGPGQVAVMADCERALGRPERALDLARESRQLGLSPAETVELRIVAAGARRDLGQLDAAVVALQGPDLDPRRREPWSARLFYAYADNLAAAGRTDDAMRWFLNAAEADDDEETDAAERAFELSEGQVPGPDGPGSEAREAGLPESEAAAPDVPEPEVAESEGSP